MSDEIRENYGGFRVISSPLQPPTIKFKENLEFDCKLNIPIRDKAENYAVDVYYNDSFVMRTNEYPIRISNQQLLHIYNHYSYMKFSFVTQRLRGNKASSAPTTLFVQKIKCADEVLCSEKVICTDKDTITSQEDGNNGV